MFQENILLPVVADRILQLIRKCGRIVLAMEGIEGERKNEDQSGGFPIPRSQIKALQVVIDGLTLGDFKMFDRIDLPGSPLAMGKKDFHALLLNIYSQ